MKQKGQCLICFSPYKDEIVSMREQKVPWKQIYEKYKKPMKYKSSANAFLILVSNHIKNNHKGNITVIQSNLKESAVTVDAFAQRMLEMGMEKLDNMEAKDLQFNDVLQAQRVVQEAKKLKLTEDAMTVMMRKMFAPPEVNVIEGQLE